MKMREEYDISILKYPGIRYNIKKLQRGDFD